jgi:pimeloyl-ACP methyl ester carboxylesterase
VKVLGFLVALLMLAALLFLTFRSGWTPRIEAPSSVSTLEDLTLGGVEQSVLIRGWDADLPILLWLHGGPGAPMMPAAHLFGRELEKHFLVVHWDQRGSGRSARSTVPAESLNIEQFLSDTRELIGILRSRFQADRIYLLGHSWGSVLGLLTAQRHPELLHAYVGMGQATNERRAEELGLEWVRHRARELGEEQALRELAGLKPPYLDDPQKIVIQRKWLSRFGGNFHRGKPFLLLRDIDRRWAYAALLSPEYSWLDLFRYLRANSRIRWALFKEFKGVNLMATVTRVDVPVYFLMGRHDHNMHPSLVQEYYDLLEAPRGKSLIWFEDSAHAPCLEETTRFVEVMVTRVLAETLPARVQGSRSGLSTLEARSGPHR